MFKETGAGCVYLDYAAAVPSSATRASGCDHASAAAVPRRFALVPFEVLWSCQVLVGCVAYFQACAESV